MNPVAWAVTFIADEWDPVRMLEHMVLFKDHARAEKYAGDPLKPHEYPNRVRALCFIEDEDDQK